VAVRNDVHRRLGDFSFPLPATPSPSRPAKSALTPLPLFRGITIPSSQFVPLDEPLHYQSGLIKLGSVTPHGRGCDVYSDQGLLPTQRTTGQGAAGATGLVMRGGVVTVVTLAESQAAQQLPETLVLTQELVGNAIPLGLVLHLGIALRDFVAPLLGTSFPTVPTPTPTSCRTCSPPSAAPAAPTAAPSPPTSAALASATMFSPRPPHRRKSPPPKMRRRLQHQIHLGGFSRTAVRRLLFKRWCYLQRCRCL
jgi:hypothetical protein